MTMPAKETQERDFLRMEKKFFLKFAAVMLTIGKYLS
jgi:hypothetical protein